MIGPASTVETAEPADISVFRRKAIEDATESAQGASNDESTAIQSEAKESADDDATADAKPGVAAASSVPDWE